MAVAVRRKKPQLRTELVEAANAALVGFASDSTIVIVGGRVCVSFRGEVRRWATRGQDFYPVWHHRWAHGGTSATALSQLVRWIQGRPVLPIGSWRYWTGPQVALGRERGPAIVEGLLQAGYPVKTPCVLCGLELEQAGDWWSLDGVSGPSCAWTRGCRQKPAEAPVR